MDSRLRVYVDPTNKAKLLAWWLALLHGKAAVYGSAIPTARRTRWY